MLVEASPLIVRGGYEPFSLSQNDFLSNLIQVEWHIYKTSWGVLKIKGSIYVKWQSMMANYEIVEFFAMMQCLIDKFTKKILLKVSVQTLLVNKEMKRKFGLIFCFLYLKLKGFYF